MDNNLLGNIKYTSNLIFANVNRLITSHRSVGIYGYGIYAERIVKRLNKWSVSVDFYVIDDKYYDKSMPDNVIKISDLNKYDRSIIIIGFETLIGREKLLIETKKKIYAYAPYTEILDFEHCYIDFDAITYDYILENNEVFQDTFDLLEDDYSRRVMIEYLNNCISGRSEDFCLLNQDCEHDYDYDLLFSKKNNGGVIIECGAFTGKTAVEIADYLKQKNDSDNKILALEPDDVNYEILCDRIKGYNNICAVKKGVSDKDGEVVFDFQGGSGSTVVNENELKDDCDYSKIEVSTINSLMKEYGNIYSIMMDIEGSELQALMGGEEVFQDRPSLAVRVYHKKNDLIVIPQFLRDLKIKPQYKLYLRNSQSTRGPLDLTLYAL